VNVQEYLNTISLERIDTISRIRELILANDKNVEESVQNTMGQPMLVYTCKGTFKYALASPKGHISFHSMVMYAHPAIKGKYMPLLPKAKFQKGCINFPRLEQFPYDVLGELIRDSAKCRFPFDAADYQKKK
jgi:hypothetical protein